MANKPIFLLISLFSFTAFFSAQAQQDRLEIVPQEEGIKIKPELRISAGVSIPLGKYAQMDSVSSKNGAAKIGGFFDVVLTHRIRKTPLWGIHLAAGYMQHGFQSDSIRARYNISSFIGKPWSVAYLMPGFGIQAGKRFKFELGLHAGLLFYNGWNVERSDYITDKIDLYWRRTWKYTFRMTGAVRGSLLLGYKINDRCLFFAEGWVQYGWGSRIGTLVQERYALDGNGAPEEIPYFTKTSRVLHSAVIFTVNIGIGIKYTFYRYLNAPVLPSDTEILKL